jgi:hypothetical protein
MKTLTKADVKRLAEDCIRANGKTSSHEVKMAARAEDFFAQQGMVSDILAEVAGEENWDRTHNTDHYEYGIPDPNAASPSQQLLNITATPVVQPATNVQDAVAQAIAPDPQNLP